MRTRGLSTSSAACGRASARAGAAGATSSTCPHTLTMSGKPGSPGGVGWGWERERERGRPLRSIHALPLVAACALASPHCCSLPPPPTSHLPPATFFAPCRVRNYLREEMASFLGLCEYTERADAARARAYFFDRRKSLLLYTERAQFYNRHRIRGAKVGVACRVCVRCRQGGQHCKLTGAPQPAVLGVPACCRMSLNTLPPFHSPLPLSPPLCRTSCSTSCPSTPSSTASCSTWWRRGRVGRRPQVGGDGYRRAALGIYCGLG